jgi:hypothetical protein
LKKAVTEAGNKKTDEICKECLKDITEPSAEIADMGDALIDMLHSADIEYDARTTTYFHVHQGKAKKVKVVYTCKRDSKSGIPTYTFTVKPNYDTSESKRCE